MTTQEIVLKEVDALLWGEEHAKLSDKITDDLGFDSLDKMDLAIRLEKAFNIHIPGSVLDDESKINVTVGEIIDYVDERIKEGEQ